MIHNLYLHYYRFYEIKILWECDPLKPLILCDGGGSCFLKGKLLFTFSGITLTMNFDLMIKIRG